MSNRCVKDNDVRILLDRREEILKQINKLEEEYKAIGNILTKLYNYEHPFNMSLDDGEER